MNSTNVSGELKKQYIKGKRQLMSTMERSASLFDEIGVNPLGIEPVESFFEDSLSESLIRIIKRRNGNLIASRVLLPKVEECDDYSSLFDYAWLRCSSSVGID